MSHAGSNYVYCCNDRASILFKDGTAALTNSVISEGAGYGVVAKSPFTFIAYGNNNITSHTLEPLHVAMSHLNALDGKSSAYSGNTRDFILLANSNVDEKVTMQATSVPYLVTENKVIDVTAGLTILPGVDLAFAQNAGLGVYDNGMLQAVGTASEKILFRGLQASQGFWRGIHVETSGNQIAHAQLRHAGSNYVYCCNQVAALFVKAGDIIVDDSWISDNGGCGIFVKAGAVLQESGNTFSNNASGHICN